MHYNEKTKQFAQVRSQKGGGVRFVTFPRTCSHADLLQKITPLFFPDGQSDKGPESAMRVTLANFQGHDISAQHFSVNKLLEERGLKTRIYLKTQKQQVSSYMCKEIYFCRRLCWVEVHNEPKMQYFLQTRYQLVVNLKKL